MQSETESTDHKISPALSAAPRELLEDVIKEFYLKVPSVREMVISKLLVNEGDVPEVFTSDSEEDSDGDENRPVKKDADPLEAKTQPTGSKRLRSRYARCINCENIFDVSKNTSQSCRYHSDASIPDEDLFPDHEECTHGPIDTPENRENYPQNFFYECCDRTLEEEGCEVSWHREDTFKRQRIY
ncbi:hypothetical protein UA08_03870 [Talaromyces atroroseus]|uniref:C2H2-type domain-containing protein n=1 Tax=Talaromyces atroroseus TaxID=1441469 RepID=A0A225AYV0_TALAT|nr:hypothetical protein UA08_03870 [Talaromyces atroroseus]OKL60889.1 hypothetical protein UA08_03870 [Talaromyces atroroseus]